LLYRYTTVGKVCQKFSEVFNRPRGIYVSSRDAGNVYRILKNWPEKRVKLVGLHLLLPGGRLVTWRTVPAVINRCFDCNIT
jgi:hypothetical protein